jgi:hypothetical protein
MLAGELRHPIRFHGDDNVGELVPVTPDTKYGEHVLSPDGRFEIGNSAKDLDVCEVIMAALVQ